jgi:HSP20 family protein
MTGIVKVQPFPATKFFTNGFLDEFFNRGIGEFVGNDTNVSQPAVNVSETDESFKVELAAPGFEKQHFALNVENGHLIVTAKREEKTEESSNPIKVASSAVSFAMNLSNVHLNCRTQ